jgi:hypothetical protein
MLTPADVMLSEIMRAILCAMFNVCLLTLSCLVKPLGYMYILCYILCLFQLLLC